MPDFDDNVFVCFSSLIACDAIFGSIKLQLLMASKV